jgi:hypothetical protein
MRVSCAFAERLFLCEVDWRLRSVEHDWLRHVECTCCCLSQLGLDLIGGCLTGISCTRASALVYLPHLKWAAALSGRGLNVALEGPGVSPVIGIARCLWSGPAALWEARVCWLVQDSFCPRVCHCERIIERLLLPCADLINSNWGMKRPLFRGHLRISNLDSVQVDLCGGRQL